jgi:hypothetical protein
MEWKAWAIVVAVGLGVLALIGVIVHSDMRLIGADVLGAFTAMAIVLLANRGRTAKVAVSVLAALALLVMALMAVTTHNSPVLTALTLALAFAFAFVSWTAVSGRRPGAHNRPRPA